MNNQQYQDAGKLMAMTSFLVVLVIIILVVRCAVYDEKRLPISQTPTPKFGLSTTEYDKNLGISKPTKANNEQAPKPGKQIDVKYIERQQK